MLEPDGTGRQEEGVAWPFSVRTVFGSKTSTEAILYKEEEGDVSAE